jgi:hypothetical protein
MSKSVHRAPKQKARPVRPVLTITEAPQPQFRGLTPNPARYMIPIILDRTRVLFFDHLATFRVYQRYGARFWSELFEPIPGGKKGEIRLRSWEALEFFVWAGLQRDAEAAGEELTVETIRENVVPDNIDTVVACLLVALSSTRKPLGKPGNAQAGVAATPVQ